MRAELDALHDALPRLDWLQIAERREGNIKLTPLDAAPEPRNLRLLKKEIAARWGTVPLIDMLKEAVLRTGCLTAATSAAARGDLDPNVLAQRLLLAVYAYGTNARDPRGGRRGTRWRCPDMLLLCNAPPRAAPSCLLSAAAALPKCAWSNGLAWCWPVWKERKFSK